MEPLLFCARRCKVGPRRHALPTKLLLWTMVQSARYATRRLRLPNSTGAYSFLMMNGGAPLSLATQVPQQLQANLSVSSIMMTYCCQLQSRKNFFASGLLHKL